MTIYRFANRLIVTQKEDGLTLAQLQQVIRDTFGAKDLIDGIEMMDYDAVTYSFSPSVDSLGQFKVETSTYSAESGGAPGAQVNLLTRSGTNDLHIALWEFNRNDALTQSYDAIAGKSVTPPRLNRNPWLYTRRGTASPADIKNAGQYTAWKRKISLPITWRSAGQ